MECSGIPEVVTSPLNVFACYVCWKSYCFVRMTYDKMHPFLSQRIVAVLTDLYDSDKFPVTGMYVSHQAVNHTTSM